MMNRVTEQNSRWFVEDIRRHAERVMNHRNSESVRLYVTDITGAEITMLKKIYPVVYRDNTGHVVIQKTVRI